MPSRSYLKPIAIGLTAPVASFGLLTAVTRHSMVALIATGAWCALVWIAYRLLRVLRVF